MIVSLNNLEKYCRSVLKRFCEYLHDVALVIIINEYVQSLKFFYVFLKFYWTPSKALFKLCVINRGNLKKLNSSLFHFWDCLDDVVCSESNMLHSWTSVVINVLLYLRFMFSLRWLGYCKSNYFVIVSHDRRSESRKLSVHCIVVYRVKLMKLKHLLVPLCSWFHVHIHHVVSNMINS